MGIGTGALIAGLFGMNVSPILYLPPRRVSAFSWTSLQLTSHMEEHPYAFLGMSVASTAIALVVAWAGLRRSGFRYCWDDPQLLLTRLAGWQRSKRLVCRRPTEGEALLDCHSRCAKSARKAGHDISTLDTYLLRLI
jgi:hypothetical protein